MNPLPKWIGWLAMAAQIANAAGALVQALPPKFAGPVAALLAIIQAVSHSLNGTGGAPK